MFGSYSIAMAILSALSFSALNELFMKMISS